MTNTLAILVSSHSKAYDLWSITNYFFAKYWANCPFKIYLGANGEDKQGYCPRTWDYLNLGDDLSWSKSMIDYLSNIDQKYILLFLDDFIILESVNEKMIQNALNFIQKKKGMMLRISPNPKGDLEFDDFFDTIDIKHKVPYSTSLQIAIWEKEFLLKLLHYNFNPWEFETQAGKTQESLICSNKFFVSKNKLISYTHFVEKGKFHPFIKDLADKEKINFDFSKRSFLSNNDLNKMKKIALKGKLINLLPNRYKNAIRKLVKKDVL